MSNTYNPHDIGEYHYQEKLESGDGSGSEDKDMYPWQTVKLVAMTQPVIVNEDRMRMSPSQLVAYCARVSNKANQGNHETAKGLCDYLVRNKHWSPLEMVDVILEIITTRDIARQILRHRSFSFQEFSQRYAEVQTLISVRDARLQDNQNRQNSTDVDVNSDLNKWWRDAQHHLSKAALEIYQNAIKAGVAKEVARTVLPEGMAETRMYMKGSLRSWVHYVDLRCANGTQREHQDIAEKCRVILSEAFPDFFPAHNR